MVDVVFDQTVLQGVVTHDHQATFLGQKPRRLLQQGAKAVQLLVEVNSNGLKNPGHKARWLFLSHILHDQGLELPGGRDTTLATRLDHIQCQRSGWTNLTVPIKDLRHLALFGGF